MREMMYLKVCWVLCAIIPLLYGFKEEVCAQDKDMQLWNAISCDVRLQKQLRLFLEEEIRWSKDVGKLYYEHTDIGLIHETRKWMTNGLFCQYIVQKNADEWEEEFRPHGDMTFLGAWKQIAFSTRNRLEYRSPDRTKNVWRYRNKVKIAYSYDVKDHAFSPYIADEYFVDFDKNSFNYNQLICGIEIGLIEHIRADVYYVWQNEEGRNAEPSGHVMGIGLSIVF